MLKSILHTHIRACAHGNGLAHLWNTATRKLGGVVQHASTAGCRHHLGRPSRPSFQPISSLLLSEKAAQSSAPPSTDALSARLSRLCLSPEESLATIQYRLPSRLPETQNAILDPVASMAIPLDCPTAVDRDFFDVPSHSPVDIAIGDPVTDAPVAKRATNILQKRHRKMKRHQYKKWRKRNRFKLRIQKQRRRKKKRERWERHLNRFRFSELSTAEGERHLAKKQERLQILLHYLGVPVDDIVKRGQVQVDEAEKTKEGQKKKKGLTRKMSPEGTGKIVPQPILPPGVQPR